MSDDFELFRNYLGYVCTTAEFHRWTGEGPLSGSPEGEGERVWVVRSEFGSTTSDPRAIFLPCKISEFFEFF